MFLIAFFQHILFIGLIRPCNRYSGSIDKPCIVSLHCGCLPGTQFRSRRLGIEYPLSSFHLLSMFKLNNVLNKN